MEFPPTRTTIIGGLRPHGDPNSWEKTWQQFFDLYHAVIRACVHAAFVRQGWTQPSAADVADTVARVMEALYRPGPDAAPIDLERYRFRQLVRMLAQRKVVDFIRRRQRHRREVANDVALEMAAQEAANDNSGPSHESVEESDAFQQAALVTLIDTLRREVSYQVFMIFDLVKLKDTPPEQVVREMGVKRGVVDNSVYKAMQKLREIAQRPDLQKEFSHE